jgi:mannosyltransferase OCH1-like enzyme
MIQRNLVRVVPETTSERAEILWQEARDLHPGWVHTTYRDPIDPAMFPRTSPYWSDCTNGAQLAGLIRLEALLIHGGAYIDSDVHLVRPLDDLLANEVVVAYEDEFVIPDAVILAEANHPAVHACLRLALARLNGTSAEPRSWMTDRGAWSTGPGVTTTVLKDRADVTVLGPESFYPVWYHPRDTLAERLAEFEPGPDTYGVHEWAFSWR